MISAIPAQMDQLLQRKAVKDVRKIHANLYLGYFFDSLGLFQYSFLPVDLWSVVAMKHVNLVLVASITKWKVL